MCEPIIIKRTTKSLKQLVKEITSSRKGARIPALFAPAPFLPHLEHAWQCGILILILTLFLCTHSRYDGLYCASDTAHIDVMYVVLLLIVPRVTLFH